MTKFFFPRTFGFDQHGLISSEIGRDSPLQASSTGPYGPSLVDGQLHSPEGEPWRVWRDVVCGHDMTAQPDRQGKKDESTKLGKSDGSFNTKPEWD